MLINKNSLQTDTTWYDYYDFKIPKAIKAKLYNSDEPIGDNLDEEVFLGNNTEYALKSLTSKSGASTNFIVVYDYQYEFDSNNLLSTIKASLGYKDSYAFHSFERHYSYTPIY